MADPYIDSYIGAANARTAPLGGLARVMALQSMVPGTLQSMGGAYGEADMPGTEKLATTRDKERAAARGMKDLSQGMTDLQLADQISSMIPDANQASSYFQRLTGRPLPAGFVSSQSRASAAEGRKQALEREKNLVPLQQEAMKEGYYLDPVTGRVAQMPFAGTANFKKLQTVPEKQRNDYTEMRNLLDEMGRVSQLIAGKDVVTPMPDNGQITSTGDKDAFGFWKGVVGSIPFVGGAALSTLDPTGVQTRAGVQNVYSLERLRRSGAAVTEPEARYLAPMIPTPFDDQETVARKTDQLRAYIANKVRALEDEYGSGSGYKPITNTPVFGPTPAGPERGLNPGMSADQIQLLTRLIEERRARGGR